MYVADQNNNRVQVFDGNGTFLRQFGTQGSGPGQFDLPYGIAVDNAGNVYVSEINNNRVQKLTSTGAFISMFGSLGSGPGQFNTPSGILIHSSGDIYVSDGLNHRIEHFDPTGAYVGQWGTFGSGNGQFRVPMGGRNVTRADIRVIAASNVRLSQLLSEGGFREDLYFRLNTISLELPSLRDRTGDIELLAEHFLRHCQAVYDKPAKILHPQLVDWLKRQEWKGNIRQLENFIHQQFLLTDGQVIRPPNPKGEQTNRAQEEYEDSHMSGTFSDLKAQVIKEFEVNYLSRLLNETNGNVTLAAKRAGKERRALGKLLKKYSIDSNKYRNSF